MLQLKKQKNETSLFFFGENQTIRKIKDSIAVKHHGLQFRLYDEKRYEIN